MPLIKEIDPNLYHRISFNNEILSIAKVMEIKLRLDNDTIIVEGEKCKLFEKHLDKFLEEIKIYSLIKQIPAGKCGLVIGRKGVTIKGIISKSGAKLNLDSKSSELSIVGFKRQVEIAEKEIDRVLNQRSTVRKEISSDKSSLIIGKEGKVIQKINQVSGAKIFIKDNSLNITGSLTQIKKAEELINDIMNVSVINLNPFELENVFIDGLLEDLERKYQVKLKINLEDYTLSISGNPENIKRVKKDIDDRVKVVYQEPDKDDIIMEFFEDYKSSESEDELFI